MQRGPLKALLAILAVAGYQNRDKIADMLREDTAGRGTGNLAGDPQSTDPQSSNPQSSDPQTGTAAAGGGLDDLIGSLQGGLGSILAGGSIGSVLNSGLGELLDQFKQAGQGDKAESWVRPGDNQPIDNRELSDALGPDVLADLAARTGLSEEDILSRLSRDLPGVVDELTPEGQVPPPQTA